MTPPSLKRSLFRLSGPSNPGGSVHVAITGHIAVIVKTPLGDPVSGASVQITNNGATGTTDSNGLFDFGDFPPDNYTVQATLGTATGSQTLNVPSGSSTQFTVTLPWTLVANWVDTQAYCGDNASLEVGVVPVPQTANVTVEILHPSTGATVGTVNGTLSGGSVQLAWTAKAQTANWRTDQISFRATVSGIGLTGSSNNQFTFKQRPTTGWIARKIDRGTPAGYADVYEVVDAALEANQVHYSLKIRLTPPSGATAVPWDAARQASEKSKIDTIWNNGFSAKKFHRKSCGRGATCDCAFDCCKLGFRFDGNFVASGEHYAVQIQTSATPGRSGTSLTGSFWVDPAGNPATDYAHEVGHMLGQFDEYSGGANDPTGTQPAVATTQNLMSTGNVSTLLNVHFRWVLEFLNANTNSDVYQIVPP